MRQGPTGPPPLWLIVLVVVGLVFAAVTIGAPGGRGMSPDTIALAVLGVVGTLVGSFGGVWWASGSKISARGGERCGGRSVHGPRR